MKVSAGDFVGYLVAETGVRLQF